MTAYFVTGATGVLGSAVAARLLEVADTRLIAVVRGRDHAAAVDRLAHAVAAQGDATAADALRSRVDVVLGDVEQPRFGLSPSDYARVVDRCTHAVHCAGAVRLNLPLDAARRAAVDSTQNVLELAERVAASGRLAKVEIVSTVGVAGRTHRCLAEDWVGATHAFHNTYEQAKAEAEELARRASDAGVPLTVHRPSMIVGDSRSGRVREFQVFYHLVEFLSGRRTRGWFPNLGGARLDIVPVDVAAAAIVRSSASPTTAGRILHLCAGPHMAPRLRALQQLIAGQLTRRGEAVPRAHFVPPMAFRALAAALRPWAPKRTRAALATLPVFLDYLATDQTFDNTRTAAWLREAGIAIPPVEEYLPRVLDFYFTTRAARRQATAADDA